MLNKIALPIHSRPEFMSIYFNCSTANSPPFWIFCRGGAVLCLLLNVSLVMVMYLDSFFSLFAYTKAPCNPFSLFRGVRGNCKNPLVRRICSCPCDDYYEK